MGRNDSSLLSIMDHPNMHVSEKTPGLFFLLYFLHGWASYPLMAPLWTDLRLCFHTPHHSSWSLKLVTHKLNPLPGMFLCNLHSSAMMVQNWVAAALLSWCVYSSLDHSPQVISFIPVWLSCPWKGMCVCDFWLEEDFQTVFPGLLRVPRGYLRNWPWGDQTGNPSCLPSHF